MLIDWKVNQRAWRSVVKNIFVIANPNILSWDETISYTGERDEITSAMKLPRNDKDNILD